MKKYIQVHFEKENDIGNRIWEANDFLWTQIKDLIDAGFKVTLIGNVKSLRSTEKQSQNPSI